MIKVIFIFLMVSQVCLAQSDCVSKATVKPSMPISGDYGSSDILILKNGEIVINSGDGVLKTFKNGAWSPLTTIDLNYGLSIVSDTANNIIYLSLESQQNPVVKKLSNGSLIDLSPSFFKNIVNINYSQFAIASNGDLYVALTVNLYSLKVFKYSAAANTWSDITGSSLTTKNVFGLFNLQTDKQGKPYIAFTEQINNIFNFKVYSYSGGSWSDIGSAGLPQNMPDQYAFKIDNTGKPCIAYYQKKISFLKFEQGVWYDYSSMDDTIGAKVGVSLDFNANNIPYVAFVRDSDHKVNVFKYENSVWDSVGTLSEVSQTTVSLKVDNNNRPNIFFSSTMWQFKNNAWVELGERGIHKRRITKTDIAKDSADNVYLIGVDSYDSLGLYKVMEDSMLLLSRINVRTYLYSQPLIRITSDNKIWLAVQEYSSGIFYLVVKTYSNGVWSTVGNNLATRSVLELKLEIIQDVPYIAYVEEGDTYKIYVKRFKNNQWETVGGVAVSNNASNNLSITNNQEGIPYLSYVEASIGIKVKKLVNDTWQELEKINFSNGDLILKINNEGTPYLGISADGDITFAKYENSKWSFLQGIYSSFLHDFDFDDQNRPVIAHSDFYSSDRGTSVSKLIDDKWTLMYRASHSGDELWSMDLLRRKDKLFLKEECDWLRFVEIDPDCIILGNKFDESKDAKHEISIYPNPSNGSVAFENIEDKCSLRILDVNGSEKGNFQLSPVNNSIDIQFLPSGIYFFKFEVIGKHPVSKKFVRF